MSNYGFSYGNAQAGQIADASIRVIDSYPYGNYNVNLDFGIAVYLNGNSLAIATSADPVIGISVFSHNHPSGYYSPYDAVSVLTKGRVYVRVSVDVGYLELAYIDLIGQYTNVAAGNKLVGMFLTSAVANDLSALEFNFDTININ